MSTGTFTESLSGDSNPGPPVYKAGRPQADTAGNPCTDAPFLSGSAAAARPHMDGFWVTFGTRNGTKTAPPSLDPEEG